MRFVLLALLVPTLAQAKPCDGPRPVADAAALQALVRAQPLVSVEELLSCLPDDLLSHHTLIHTSQSPERDAVDPLHPRVILFGSDGHLLIAYTGDVAPHAGQVQVLEWRDAEARWALSEIEFGPKGAEVYAAPAGCYQCHGADPHPIWATYPLWPGAYGSANDVLLEGTAEAAQYAAFRAGPGKSPRYAPLQRAGFGAAAPYFDSPSAAADQPNLHLTKVLARYNARRLQRQLAQSPAYPALRASLLASLLYCSHAPLPAARVRAAQARLDQDRRAQLKQLPKSYFPATAPPGWAEGVVRVQQVAERLGVSTRGWALTRDEDSLDLDDGDAGADDLLASAIFDDLARTLPALQPLGERVIEGNYLQDVGAHDGAKRYGAENFALFTRLGGPLRHDNVAKICRVLSSQQGAADPPTAPSGGEELLLSACGSCHVSGDAARLPLADAAALKRALAEHPELGRELRARLRARDASRMPPNRTLTATELATIARYLDGLE
jgi:mono/diheme cytochrome c family protein